MPPHRMFFTAHNPLPVPWCRAGRSRLLPAPTKEAEDDSAGFSPPLSLLCLKPAAAYEAARCAVTSTGTDSVYRDCQIRSIEECQRIVLADVAGAIRARTSLPPPHNPVVQRDTALVRSSGVTENAMRCAIRPKRTRASPLDMSALEAEADIATGLGALGLMGWGTKGLRHIGCQAIS